MTALLTRTMSYADGDTPLTGALYWPDGPPRPGILLVHGGAGLDDHAHEQARRYAGLGYTVLACQMFALTGDRERTVQTLTALRDNPDDLVRRARAGLAVLDGAPEAGGTLAAVGFCFGGLVALTLARAGVELAGVVSIHGSLGTVRPARPGAVTAKVLACHGAADPHVPMAHVATFAEEMDAAGADWQLNVYGGAQHGFTHRNAVPGVYPGVAYHPEADARAFAATRAFLDALT